MATRYKYTVLHIDGDDSLLAQATFEEGGYDCEFVEHVPSEVQQECSVCLLILKEPVITSCCGYSFCRACIDKVKSVCPLCNSSEFSTFPNKGLQRLLLSFQVNCCNKKYGCEWKGKLSELERHLNIGGGADRTTGCAYVWFDCLHRCGSQVRRRDLLEHEAGCLERPKQCQYCEEFFPPSRLYIHWKFCKHYPVLCPNRCTEVTYPRQKLEEHLNEECPLLPEKCVTCEKEIARLNMATHMEACQAKVVDYGISIIYPEYETQHSVSQRPSDSLESKLYSESMMQEQLQEKVRRMKVDSGQIRQTITKLQSECEGKACSLKSELQMRCQQIEHCEMKISQKENEISQLREAAAKDITEDSEYLKKKENYERILKQVRETKEMAEASKYKVELELEKEKHHYEMKIKELELEQECKRTSIAEKEAVVNLRALPKKRRRKKNIWKNLVK